MSQRTDPAEQSARPSRRMFVGTIAAVAGALLTERGMSQASANLSAVSVRIASEPKPISPDLFGIFFEDLNFAADGGLYAELIRNRSFDFSALENSSWNQLTGWEVVQRGGRAHLNVDGSLPIHPNNPTYAVLETIDPGQGAGIANDGYDGIAVKAGETYDFSMFARYLYGGGRWDGQSPNEAQPGQQPVEGTPGPLIVRLETKEGDVLAEASVALPEKAWTRLTATLNPSRTETAARFVLLMTVRGGIALDMVSLFPRKTFRDRKNGLRADLAQTIADLKPRFVRFPGGCLVHGNGMGNFYRWKDTIGPVEHRKGQPNLWRYHQSVGLGYFEYFQFCEDIGAMPLPVVPAGVSCQNSDFQGGTGQQALPLEEMPAYIREVLDLIEWANGPATSTWGAKRAEVGHPEPFNLKYLGVGNEEHITPAFKERFKLIHDAIKAKHPEIVVIGTSGPSWRGEDYEKGWAIARELGVEMVDEHYYVHPDWFWDHLDFYDTYDRTGAKVYLGEYAAHERDRKSTLRSALAEAAYMTAMERNGDIVSFASYAPLLGKHRRTQWTPDLIYFDNTTISPTINYEVQKLFGHHAGDEMLPVTVEKEPRTGEGKAQLAASCVRDRKSGDVIVKIVSRSDEKIAIKLDGLPTAKQVTRIELRGDPDAENRFGETPSVTARTEVVAFDAAKPVEIPPHSLTILRFTAK